MSLASCDSQLVCREALCHFSVIIIVDLCNFTKFKLSFCSEKITLKRKKIKAFKKRFRVMFSLCGQ